MLKIVIKIVGAWIVLETAANLGKGYMLGCMLGRDPESEEGAFWHECAEYGSEKSCIDKAKAVTILAGEKIGKHAMERAMES